jgi:hypothetical protein
MDIPISIFLKLRNSRGYQITAKTASVRLFKSLPNKDVKYVNKADFVRY